MASTLQQYHQLADHMASQITGSYQSWTDFLTTAARLYKYPYHRNNRQYLHAPGREFQNQSCQYNDRHLEQKRHSKQLNFECPF